MSTSYAMSYLRRSVQRVILRDKKPIVVCVLLVCLFCCVSSMVLVEFNLSSEFCSFQAHSVT